MLWRFGPYLWKTCHVAYVIILSALYKTLLFLTRAFRILSNVWFFFLASRYPRFCMTRSHSLAKQETNPLNKSSITKWSHTVRQQLLTFISHIIDILRQVRPEEKLIIQLLSFHQHDQKDFFEGLKYSYLPFIIKTTTNGNIPCFYVSCQRRTANSTWSSSHSNA